MKQIYIGAAYYPEMWEESEVEKDIARCKELGINTLRVGEFAWGKMEPQEGKYNFEWLLRVVDKLHANGIHTVMCTPTCTPPRWMLNRYPEMRRVMPDLHRADVSSRVHVCKSSKIAREKNRRIVTEAAKVFAGHKGIIGWQIDNEFFPYEDGCYCENCKAGFRAYLKDKFGTTDNLNKAWGMTRWSLEYDTFEEVEPPYAHQWRHPSLRKAWWDYQCRLIKEFSDEQADILHAYGCKNVGTDMMTNNCLGMYAVNEKLDVVQYNHYDPADRLYTNVFAYDFLRCIKDKPFWVTETQVGWNGSEFAEFGYRPAGCCYANTWLPIAKGAEMNLYWLFRAHPNGHELAHGALFSTAGRSYRVSEEVKRAGEDFVKCADFLTESKIKSKIAMHYSNTAVNSLNIAPLVKGLDYRQVLLEKFHAAFRHYNVDVIDTPHVLEGYEVIVSPFLTTLDEHGLKERIVEWVQKGGIWIVGPMSDIYDGEDISKFTHAPYGCLEELAGVYTKYQKPVGNSVFKAKWQGGGDCPVSTCYDAYECKAGTTALASYLGDEFDGLAAVTERKVGKGKIVLLGSVLSHEALRKLARLAPIAKASENIALIERSGNQSGIIAVELENKEGYVELDGSYLELISGKTVSGKYKLSPYGVAVFKSI
ncbi:MAG: beta-galactosidase [Clostridia bacterium]|nr:beta-galactosidase [Clostridia bacterium]